MAVLKYFVIVALASQIKPGSGPKRYQAFPPRETKDINGQIRVWPNPKWISVSWIASADTPFKSIQEEATVAYREEKTFSKGSKWGDKFEKAYNEYYNDYQNPVKLFAVATYYSVAIGIEPNFAYRPGIAEKWFKVNAGFDYLKDVPKSYLFVRRAYMANAGDLDKHDYGDLASRLLEKRPNDRGVIIAMAYESQFRHDKAFEEKVFRLLDAIKAKGDWRPWDDYHYAFALQFRALRHKDVSWLDKALALAKSAKGKSPNWADTKWIDKYINEIPGLKKYIKDNS